MDALTMTEKELKILGHEVEPVAAAGPELEKNDKNKMDTVTMARQEREDNGLWEAEVSYGGEADLHRHLDGCGKNPGHLEFVPVDLFDVDHLPSGYQDNLLVEMIRAVSDLTVRVSVKYVSERRHEKFPGTDKLYPCYRNRGSNMMRVGTGWVSWVRIYPNNHWYNKTSCDCKECLTSPTSKTQFSHINIHTAAHVVYDDIEAADTTCHLFFDRGGTPDACEGGTTLSGMSDVRKNIDGDSCSMIYVTHDLDLAHRLDKMVRRRQNMEDEVLKRYDPINFLPLIYKKENSRSEPDPLPKLTFIVSHPHGCSKHISVGYCTNTDERWGDYTKHTYTASTCPGSSGALVCVMGEGWRDSYFSHVHCGNCEGNRDLNFSFWIM